jgi:hypothetical protein
MNVPPGALDVLVALLPSPEGLIEPLPPRRLADIVESWLDLARALAQRPAPRVASARDTRGTAAALFVARYRPALAALVSRGDLRRAPTEPIAGDDVHVLAVSPDETRVGPNQPFEIRVRLRNAGTVAWGDDRLLLRLGPPISSTIAQTAPVLPVPPTVAGGTCDIVVPGRGHYLPGRCVVTYVMTFANGKPCLPGGLSLPISTVAELHSTLSLHEQVAALFRKRRNDPQ